MLASEAEKSLIENLVQVLRNTEQACAKNGSIHGWSWVRYHNDEWQAIRYNRKTDKKKSVINATTLTEDELKDWLAENPVSFMIQSEASLYDSTAESVWEEAAEQHVFDDVDRCFYCGYSEITHALSDYKTTDDGTCTLCPDCHTQWENAGEIVAPAAD